MPCVLFAISIYDSRPLRLPSLCRLCTATAAVQVNLPLSDLSGIGPVSRTTQSCHRPVDNILCIQGRRIKWLPHILYTCVFLRFRMEAFHQKVTSAGTFHNFKKHMLIPCISNKVNKSSQRNRLLQPLCRLSRPTVDEENLDRHRDDIDEFGSRIL